MLHSLEHVRDHQNSLTDTAALPSCQAPQLGCSGFAAKKVYRHRAPQTWYARLLTLPYLGITGSRYNPAALNNLAWLYQRQGDLAKARELAERAFAAAPAAAQIDDTLGWILVAQGEADRAMPISPPPIRRRRATQTFNITSRWRSSASADRPTLRRCSRPYWAPAFPSPISPRR